MISGETRLTASARAGFWVRFGASLIDGLIVGAVTGILEAVLKTPGEVIAVIFGIAYFVYFEGGPHGAGPGKRAMRIRVVDIGSGHPIGYPRAFVRYVGRIVSTVVFFLGYFWMLWDPQKQCWHDKFAGDVVVPEGAVY